MKQLANLETTDWYDRVKPELPEDYFEQLLAFLVQAYGTPGKVYPPRGEVFKAYQETPLANTKVVIVGQDPYHEEGQAMGLSFSVPDQVTTPPSLNNIFQELKDDLDIDHRDHNDLTGWAKEGVLLLNSSLTVRQHDANAHAGQIWEPLTDVTIKVASQDDQPKVFILWGKFAQSKVPLIDQNKHLIIQSPHPSPLSAYRGFFKTKPFSQANDFLIVHGRQPIDWQL